MSSNKKNKKIKKVAIIGMGPAGMAAALQLKHFGIEPFLFEKDKNGSLLKNAWLVGNYLGVYPGKAGPELLKQFRSHLARKKIMVDDGGVDSLEYNFKTKLFLINTSKKSYNFSHVVIATGTKPVMLLEDIPPAIQDRLFYDVFPLLKKRKKRVLIIGAGDAAFDNAINLAKDNEIIICNRSKDIDALTFLVNKAKEYHNISYLEDHKLCNIAIEGSGLNRKLGLLFLNDKKHVCLEADCLLVDIGRLPQKDFYTPKIVKQEKRLIKEGRLCLVGDVKNDIYRQVAIAVGDGVRGATQIFHDLKNEYKSC